ncbi:hypothetical protein [Methylobacterium segetis]|uniref:hypothetical protein n=1 Tax=Methylobacterium segetis TaxID=2488750 RepID=UPI001043CA26|nr:hypothetical protein [Methylobacterium segetis]
MPLRRSISWNAALRDLRADRMQVSAEARRAHCRREVFAKLAANRARQELRARPLVVAGRYDRRAIMAAAVAQARREATGDAWASCLSAALTGVWQVAKVARRAAAH